MIGTMRDGRRVTDIGVMLSLAAATGFINLDFWKSSGKWVLSTFNSKENSQITLSRDEVASFARQAVSRTIQIDYARPEETLVTLSNSERSI